MQTLPLVNTISIFSENIYKKGIEFEKLLKPVKWYFSDASHVCLIISRWIPYISDYLESCDKCKS